MFRRFFGKKNDVVSEETVTESLSDEKRENPFSASNKCIVDLAPVSPLEETVEMTEIILTEEEIDFIVKQKIRNQMPFADVDDLSRRDGLFEEAARLVVMEQQGSTSLIQRRFAIGYNRAGRIMDQLEAFAIVGPAEGSKPREVKITDLIKLDRYLAEEERKWELYQERIQSSQKTLIEERVNSYLKEKELEQENELKEMLRQEILEEERKKKEKLRIQTLKEQLRQEMKENGMLDDL